MGQTVSVEVTAYYIRVSELAEGCNDKIIEIYAEVSDFSGNVIGEVETDYFDTARNLPLALVKVYQLERKLRKGTLDLSINF